MKRVAHWTQPPKEDVLSHLLKSSLFTAFVVDDIFRKLRPTHEELLMSAEESRAEVAALAAIVTDMRDTIRCLTAENGGAAR
jgi:hypothetical protein